MTELNKLRQEQIKDLIDEDGTILGESTVWWEMSL